MHWHDKVQANIANVQCSLLKVHKDRCMQTKTLYWFVYTCIWGENKYSGITGKLMKWCKQLWHKLEVVLLVYVKSNILTWCFVLPYAVNCQYWYRIRSKYVSLRKYPFFFCTARCTNRKLLPKALVNMTQDFRMWRNIGVWKSIHERWNNTCKNEKDSHGAQESTRTVARWCGSASCTHVLRKKHSLEISHCKCPTVQHVSSSKIATAWLSWEFSPSCTAIASLPSSGFQIRWYTWYSSNVSCLKDAHWRHHCHLLHFYLWQDFKKKK